VSLGWLLPGARQRVLPAGYRVCLSGVWVRLELAEQHDRQRIELDVYSVRPGALQRRDGELHVKPVQQQQ